MAKMKKGLGRGLNAMIPETVDVIEASSDLENVSRETLKTKKQNDPGVFPYKNSLPCYTYSLKLFTLKQFSLGKPLFWIYSTSYQYRPWYRPVLGSDSSRRLFP